jgi:hypothetical protein
MVSPAVAVLVVVYGRFQGSGLASVRVRGRLVGGFVILGNLRCRIVAKCRVGFVRILDNHVSNAMTGP